jgi:DNA-binding transcriptional LysR family regulator
VYRKRATDALDKARRPWRVAYSCSSLAGSIAAVRAGLGLAVLPKEMVPAGLNVIHTPLLPDLKDTEIALLAGPRLRPPVAKLRSHIIRCLD